jgi:hypothetical protein
MLAVVLFLVVTNRPGGGLADPVASALILKSHRFCRGAAEVRTL